MKIKRSHFELSCALWLACGVVALGQDAASKAAPSLPGPVTPIALPAAITSAQASARKATYSVAVPGSGDWTDAGFAIAAGETVSYSATRQLTLWDARASAPAGVARGWKDLLRQFPLDSASTGALIGRIGNADAAVPFAIGGQLEQTVPANGELFLAANVPKEVGAQGTYQVSMKITAAKPTSQATVQQDTALLTPALLDGGTPARRRRARQSRRHGELLHRSHQGRSAEGVHRGRLGAGGPDKPGGSSEWRPCPRRPTPRCP